MLPGRAPWAPVPHLEMESGLQLISGHRKAWGEGSLGPPLQSLAIKAIDALAGAAKGRGSGKAPAASITGRMEPAVAAWVL